MASGGFFRGTSVDQDSRYFNQNKKLLAKLSFPPCFDQKVDLVKVKREVIGQWITERVTQLLGFEDDIVISMIINLLEPKVDEKLDPRHLQLTLTGFLEKDAPLFMKELWELLLSAQAHPTGIPPAILEKKKQEMAQAAQDKQQLRSVLDRKREDTRGQADRREGSSNNSAQQQGPKTYGLTSGKPPRESHYGGRGGGADAGPRRERDRSAPRPSRRRSPSPPPRIRRRHRSPSRSRSRSRSRSSSRSPSRSRSRGRDGRRGRASEPRRRSRSDSRGRSRKSRAHRSPSSSPDRRPSRKDRGGRRSPSPRKKRDQRSPSRSPTPDQFGRNRRRTLSTSPSRSNSRGRRSRSRG